MTKLIDCSLKKAVYLHFPHQNQNLRFQSMFKTHSRFISMYRYYGYLRKILEIIFETHGIFSIRASTDSIRFLTFFTASLICLHCKEERHPKLKTVDHHFDLFIESFLLLISTLSLKFQSLQFQRTSLLDNFSILGEMVVHFSFHFCCHGCFQNRHRLNQSLHHLARSRRW